MELGLQHGGREAQPRAHHQASVAYGPDDAAVTDLKLKQVARKSALASFATHRWGVGEV